MLPMNSMEKEDRLLDSPSSRFAFSFQLKNWRNCVGVLDVAWLQNGLRIRQAFFSKKVAVLPNQEARRRTRRSGAPQPMGNRRENLGQGRFI